MKTNFVETLATIKFAATNLINEHLEPAFKDKAKVIIKMANDIAARHNIQPQMDTQVCAMLNRVRSIKGN